MGHRIDFHIALFRDGRATDAFQSNRDTVATVSVFSPWMSL